MLNLLDEEQFGIIWDRILYYEDKIRQMCAKLGLAPEKSETDPVQVMHEFLKSAKPFESTGANRGPLLYTDIKVRHYNFN